MIFNKATIKDIGVLTDLRIACLQEDLGAISGKDLELMKATLPSYYEKHLNKDLMAYVAKKLMTMMLEDSKAEGVSVIELKATEDGYLLYKSVAFEDVVAKYHNMKIVLQ